MKKRKFHIAIFTDTYRPQVNGVITSIDHLSQRLTERGHRITILSPTITGHVTPPCEGVSLINVPSIPASYYDDFRWSTLRTAKIMDKLAGAEVDLVHFMTPVFTCYLGIKIARKLGVPVVGTYHTLIADPTYYEQLLKHIIKATPESVWYYTNLYYDKADLVTAPTQTMADLLKQNHCATETIALSNGIDPGVFDNSRSDEITEKYGLTDKTVLYVGRVSEEKNMSILLDAFDRAYEQVPEAKLLIVGDGPKRRDIEKYAAGKRAASAITFTGMIPHDELVKSGIFGACRFFATASETETQGITLLEALHNGLPCLGADALGVSETISHGETGYLVPRRNTEEMARRMVELLTHDELIASMGAAAKEWIKPHYIESIIARWESIYLDLIDRNNRGELEKKDYLHIKEILTTVRRFKIEIPFLKKPV